MNLFAFWIGRENAAAQDLEELTADFLELGIFVDVESSRAREIARPVDARLSVREVKLDFDIAVLRERDRIDGKSIEIVVSQILALRVVLFLPTTP